LGKKTVGVRIDRVPNIIVAGVCLYNFALDQGENPEIDDQMEDEQDEEELVEEERDNLPAANEDAARYAQGLAHRQWLVERYCQD